MPGIPSARPFVHPPVVLLDACVLFPAQLRSLLLHLALRGQVQPRWTDAIHDEWIGALLEQRPHLSRAALERTRVLMDTAVPSALVGGYEHHIAALTLPDPDDRHVLAAAIEASADVLLTWNAKDFPDAALATFGLRREDPDAFLCRRLDAAPAAVRAAAEDHRTSLRSPPMEAAAYRASLARAGLTRFAAWL